MNPQIKHTTDLANNQLYLTEKFKYRGRKSTTIVPKKNKSAFLMFSNDMRPIVKQSNKQLGQNQIMKQLATLWREITHEQKTKYEIMAQEDKDRYLREKRDFLTANPLAIIGNRTKKNHVHKPRSSYALFMSEKFSHVKDVYPHLETGEIVSKVAKEWRSLTQQQKAVYKQKADEEKLSKRMELQKRAVKDLASTDQGYPTTDQHEEEEEEGHLCKVTKRVKTDTKECMKNQRESIYSHQFLSEDSLHSPTEDSNGSFQPSNTISEDSPFSHCHGLYNDTEQISVSQELSPMSFKDIDIGLFFESFEALGTSHHQRKFSLIEESESKFSSKNNLLWRFES